MIKQQAVGLLQALLSRVKCHLTAIAMLLIALPPLIELIYIKIYGVNVVFWDQWAFIPLIGKLYSGTLTISDIFAQHNEHRIVFPKLIMLASAYLTNYDCVAEMLISWCIAFAIMVLLFVMIGKYLGDKKYKVIAFVPVAWMVFNLNQYQNILWGWQIQIYLCVLAMLASMYFLESANDNKGRFILSVLFAFISSFSFFSGLLTWPAGVILLLAKDKKIITSRLFAWLICGILTMGLFFYHWSHPEYEPSVLFPFQHPGIAFQYLLTILGSPWTAIPNFAILMGGIMILIVIAIAWLIIHDHSFQDNGLWLALISFSLFTALACTSGRSGYGVDQALKSRYITLMIPGIIGAYMIIIGMVRRSSLNYRSYVLIGLVIALFLISIIGGYAEGFSQAQASQEWRINSIALIKGYQGLDTTTQQAIFPTPSVLLQDKDILKKYRLNIYYTPEAEKNQFTELIEYAKPISLPDYQPYIFGHTTINGESKIVIYEYPDISNVSTIKFSDIYIPENSRLELNISTDPDSWVSGMGNGAEFQVYILNGTGRSLVFSEYIDPVHNASERKWNNYKVDLSAYFGRNVSFIFNTLPGPNNNNNYDPSLWGDPAIDWSDNRSL